ncbi:MAG TPA: translocation/assembly module TamB domain-containing protein, partial [Rhodocyclaceae bacterium]|nr:translocation/assembly module TamB domain-containing protein [Rhodocyclaceae bacterium]
TAWWLAATESGLAVVCALAGKLSGGRLALIPAGGTLAGPLRLHEARWQGAGMSIRVEEASLDWTPAELRHGRLAIARGDAATVRLIPGPKQEPATPPASLRLPVALRVDEFRIGRLERGDTLLAEDIAGELDSDGVRHRLTRFQARAHAVALSGEGEIGGDAPFPLQARIAAASQWEGHAFSLLLQADGTLATIDLSGQASGALAGKLSARATPFAPQPIQRLQVHLKGIDPAAWLAGAPLARLDLDADLLPRLDGQWRVAGPFAIANREPGRLSDQRLPILRLTGRVAWQGDQAELTALAAALAGGGSLTGHGRLAGKQLSLELAASRLDAAQFHPKLRPTRLSGPISIQAGQEVQTLAADLADPRFRLAARLNRRGGRVEAESLQLTAGPARLQAQGHLDIGPGYRFSAQGQLARFDPSRFAQVPAASLNAAFDAAGSIRPRPVVSLRFDLHDSRFRGQPLAGRGELEVDWPAVRKADVSLSGGPNRLTARGAFGRSGDRLDIAINAPALAPYGIEGGIQGEVQLAGTPASPAIGGRLQAARLGLPGVGRVEGLSAEGKLGPRAEDALDLTISGDRLDLPNRPAAARDIALRIEGSRARHQLRGSAALDRQRRLALAATGGLGEKAGNLLWVGQLRELTLAAANPDQSFRLVLPAPLRLGTGEWSVGPAEVAGSGWQGRLLATASGERLHAEASGRGERLGTIDARLDARLQGAWHLAPTALWAGRLNLAAADISWLGPFLGDDWRTGGHLRGELALAGTPSRPLLSGQVRGEGLGLRIPDQGLQLENGTLRADLTGDRLQVADLAFDSRLQPLPRAIPKSGDLARLTATPGRLTVQGEIELGGSERAGGSERGFLDLHLDRVGVLQQADQWVAVSGSGRVRWQGAALGAEGKLAVDAGYWELARLGTPKLSDDVVVHRKTAEGKTPPPTRPRLDLDIDTDLGPHFHFSGFGLESRLAGSVRIKASGQDLPRATGTIQTVEGKFDAYGQKLAVERGIINFQGFLDNPVLNVRAVRKGLPVEPGVEVTGPVKKPVVRLVSDPELPEAEKLSWLVLGHGSEQLGSNDASTLLNAASGLLGRESSGSVVQQLQRRLGIEDFGVRQGQLGDPGGRQATSRVASSSGFSGTTPATTGSQIVSVSKRLSANAVLSYEQALGRTENIVKLTVNLSRRLSVVGRAGSDNAIDLFYTFSFGK